MGVVTGYYLQRAGANVTFLVRPHRQESLARAQVLYSYDDQCLKTYSGYKLLTDPEQLSQTSFDFVIITLDGAALRAEAGLRIVDAVGQAFRNTSTGVILGSVGIDLKSWFIERSGLSDSQVTLGLVGALVYEVKQVDLPVHEGINSDLLAGADYGYRHLSPAGFMVDLSAPEVAEGFAELFNRNGFTQCSLVPADEFRAMVTGLAAIVGWELLGWPHLTDVDPGNETWRLGAEAMREFQQLSIFGPEANASADALTPEGVLQLFATMENNSLPLDFAGFNRYHHGGKVNGQDHQIIREALSLGQSAGKPMPALGALIDRLPQ